MMDRQRMILILREFAWLPAVAEVLPRLNTMGIDDLRSLYAEVDSICGVVMGTLAGAGR